MYVLSPVTDRVAKMREKYRTTRPSVCIARYKIVTEFYKENPQLQGILKRAKNFKNICEKLPVLINKDEVIVGWQAAKYRACALYPETSFGWFLDELKAGTIPLRDTDPYDIDEKDAEYILSTGDFWRKECLSAKVDEYIPLGIFQCRRQRRHLLRHEGHLLVARRPFCRELRKSDAQGLWRHPRGSTGKNG